MNKSIRLASLAPILFSVFASATYADCRTDIVGSVSTTIEHFHAAPSQSPGILGFQLADLRGTGELELVQGSYQVGAGDFSYAPSTSLLLARERVGNLSYRTRAALQFPAEFFVGAFPMDGAFVGVSGKAVLLISRARDFDETRVRVIDGLSWTSAGYCSIPFRALAADVAPGAQPGSMELYLQDASAMHVFSLDPLSELRTLPAGAGTGFKLAQLDDDVSPEIILAGAPGRIVDGISGIEEWNYPPGFGSQIAVGTFGLTSYQGFATDGPTSVRVFSATPYAMAWETPTVGVQRLSAASVSGNGVDNLFVAGTYMISQFQSVQSVRAFNVAAQSLIAEDAESRFDIAAFGALEGRSGGPLELIEEHDYTLWVHALGTPGDIWSERASVRPFVSFATGKFGDAGAERLVFSGYADGSSAARLFVLDPVNWAETSQSPPRNFPGSITVEPVGDVVALRSDSSAIPQLVVGGYRFYGAEAAVNVADWHSNWYFGIDNNPNDAPLGFRAVQRMASLDFNGDGQDDVVTGAGAVNSGESGSQIVVLSGQNGAELWRSQPMGSNFESISDLRVTRDTNQSTTTLYVAGSAGVFSYDLPSGNLRWSIPLPAYATGQFDGDKLAVAGYDGSLRYFDNLQAQIWQGGSYDPIRAISQPIPRGPLLIAAGSRLRWLDHLSGAQIGVSAPVTSSLALGNRWQLSPDALLETVQVIAGGDAGFFSVRVALPPRDEIFFDGAE